jgi:hypothetical protein
MHDHASKKRHAIPGKGTHKRQIHIYRDPVRVIWLHPHFPCAREF